MWWRLLLFVCEAVAACGRVSAFRGRGAAPLVSYVSPSSLPVPSQISPCFSFSAPPPPPEKNTHTTHPHARRRALEHSLQCGLAQIVDDVNVGLRPGPTPAWRVLAYDRFIEGASQLLGIWRFALSRKLFSVQLFAEGRLIPPVR